MPTIRLAAAALNQTPIDWEGNLSRVVAAIDAARAEEARLLVLPELCLCGYGCEDLYFASYVRQRSLASLRELLPRTKGIAVTVGLPLAVDGVLYNAEAMLADGELLGFSLKQILANNGILYEARWFKPWPEGTLSSLEFDGKSVPIGELVYSFAGIGVGMEICRDAWEANRPAPRLAKRGVSLLINPSASHFEIQRQALRETLTRGGAAAIDGYSLYVNLLGNESGRSIFDGGILLAKSSGEGDASIIADGERFTMTDHSLLVVDCDLETRVKSNDPHVVPADFSLVAPTKLVGAYQPEIKDKRRSHFEEFSRAVPLALLDYLRKSGANGFVLSLSGGADSAACAVMIWLMVRQAVDQLGYDGLAERLPQTPGLRAAKDIPAAVRCLLMTVYQGTQNSSAVTRDAAQALAEAVGAEHHAWEIDPLVRGYVELAASAIGRELAWESDDVVLQNIQARVRSPGVWMLANFRNALLLTTGNRSEASVGYATMDGDTSGGLAPLAGIDKAFLREWLRWMESEGPADGSPLPALSVINSQQPTAELRPTEESQTDEADLMPYDVLDEIERSAIARLEDRQTTIRLVAERHSQYDSEQIAQWVDRFWQLWRGSQWKRMRMAPGFHVDSHSLDPAGFRRWPLLSADTGGRS